MHATEHKDQLPNQLQQPIDRIRWASLIIVSILTFAAIVGPIIAFCVTKISFSLIFLSFASLPGYMLYRIIKSLWPLNDKDYVIEKIMAQVATQRVIKEQLNKQPGNEKSNQATTK